MKEAPKTNIRNTTKTHYVVIYESFYKNNELSTDAKALFLKLLTSAPTFKVCTNNLAKVLHISTKRVNKASKELQKFGYLKIKGRKEIIWEITQTPTIELTKDQVLTDNEIINNDLIALLKTGVITQTQFNNAFNRLVEIAKTKWITTNKD